MARAFPRIAKSLFIFQLMLRRPLTVGERISGAFLLFIALLAAVAGFSWRGLVVALHDFDEYRHCARSSVVAGRIQANFLVMRVAANQFLLSRDDKPVKEYQARHEKVVKFLADAREEIFEPERLKMVDEIAKGTNEYAEIFRQLRDTPAAAGLDAILEIRAKLAARGDSTADVAENLKLSVITQQDQIGPRAHASIQATVVKVLVSGLVTALVAILAAVFVVRSLNRLLKGIASSIDEGSDQVASAAAQVSAASQALAQGASEQAAALEETSSSIEEISSMTKSNAIGSHKAKDLANRTREAAESGAAATDEMSRAMLAIKGSSDEMAKILKTIDEIAFQTNILALNAAVEAARAGEAGAGFAVVADEVRSLAQRSAQSAKETSTKIEDSMRKCENGVRISEQVAENLREILGRAKEVDTVIAEISRASEEQNEGLSQVSTAVSQMDKVTQSNASGAEEAAASAEELTAQAEAQKDNVAQLLALVGKQSGRNAASSPAVERKPAYLNAPERSRSKTADEPELVDSLR